MKVFGHPISVTTRHVLMALAEKGQDAEFISIDVFQNEQKQAAHLVRQPFGHIPVIEDGAFKLYETPGYLAIHREPVAGSATHAGFAGR